MALLPRYQRNESCSCEGYQKRKTIFKEGTCLGPLPETPFLLENNKYSYKKTLVISLYSIVFINILL